MSIRKLDSSSFHTDKHKDDPVNILLHSESVNQLFSNNKIAAKDSTVDWLSPADQLLDCSADVSTAETTTYETKSAPNSSDFTRSELPAIPGFNPKATKAEPGETRTINGARVTFTKSEPVLPETVEWKDMTCTYSYNAGKLTQAVLLGADKKVLFKLESSGNNRSTITVGNEKTENVQAIAWVRGDGTWAMRSKDVKLELRDQAIILDHAKGGNKFRDVVDQNQRLSYQLQPDSNFRLMSATDARGKRSFQYDAQGSLCDVTDISKYGSVHRYTTTDGGTSWQRTADGITTRGILKLENNSVKFIENPDVSERMETVDYAGESRPAQLGRMESAYRLAREMVNIKLQNDIGTKTDEIFQKLKLDLKSQGKELSTLSQEEQEEVLEKYRKDCEQACKDLQEKTRQDYVELDKDLKKITGAKPETTTEQIWSSLEHIKPLYNDYVSWLENKAIPQHLRLQCGVKDGKMIVGGPHKVPMDRGSRMDFNTYKVHAAKGDFEGDVHLNISPDLPPSKAEIDTINDANQWLEKVQTYLHDRRLDFEMREFYPAILASMDLPAWWIEDSYNNREGHRALLADTIPIRKEMKSLADTLRMEKTELAKERENFKVEISDPPGMQDLMERQVRYNWPDLVLNDKTVTRNEEYAKWRTENKTKINDLLLAMNTDKQNIVFYGNISGNAYVVLDKGEIKEIFDKPLPSDTSSAAKEHLRKIDSKEATPVNLFKSDAEVVDKKDGRIHIYVKLQACEAELLDYMNFGAKEVGKLYSKEIGPVEIDKATGVKLHKGFAPDAPVAIRYADGTNRVCRADQVESLINSQYRMHWLQEGSTMVMDAATVASIVASGGAALPLALLRKGSVTAAAWGFTKLAFFGSSYVLNNAKAHSDPTLSKVNEIRNDLLVLYTAKTTFASMLGGGAQKVQAAEQMLDKSSRLARAVGYVATKSSGIQKTADRVNMVTNVPFGYMVYQDIKGQIARLNKLRIDSHFDTIGGIISGKDVPMNSSSLKASNGEKSLSSLVENLKTIAEKTDIQANQKRKIEEINARVTKLMPAGAKESKETKKERLDYAQSLASDLGHQDYHGRDVILAAGTALLLLTDNEDGSLARGQFPVVDGKNAYEKFIGALKSADVNNASDRMMSVDLLVRLEERSPAVYTWVLKDTIESRKASTQERIAAIAQVAPYIAILKGIEVNQLQKMPAEQRHAFLRDTYGVTSRDLTDVVKQATESGDKSVRAFACGVLSDMRTEQSVEALQEKVLRRSETVCQTLFAENKDSKIPYDIQMKKEFQSQIDASKGLQEMSGPRMLDTMLDGAIGMRDLKEMGTFSGKAGPRLFNELVLKIAEQASNDVAAMPQLQRALEHLECSQLAEESRITLCGLMRDIITRPVTTHNIQLKMDVLKKLPSFKADKNEAEILSHALTGMLYQPRQHGAGPLNALVIENLAKLDCGDWAGVVARHTIPTNPKNPRLGGEPNPLVRLAAVTALSNRLELEENLTTLLDAEDDLAVRNKLMECRLKSRRPVREDMPDSEITIRYNRLFENGIASRSKSGEWLQMTFAELPPIEKTIMVPKTKVVFASGDRTMDKMGNRLNPPGFKEVPDGEQPKTVPNDGYMKHIKARLFEPALHEGGKAERLALVQLLLDTKPRFPHQNDEIKKDALNTLLKLTVAGEAFRGDVLPGLREYLLTRNEHEDIASKRKILEKLEEDVRSEAAGSEHRVHFGMLVADVIDDEFQDETNLPSVGEAPFQERNEYRKLLLELIRKYNTGHAYPMLDAISRAEGHQFTDHLGEEFHKGAKDLLADLRDSVVIAWNSTPYVNLEPEARLKLAKEAVAPTKGDNDYVDLRLKRLFQSVSGESIKLPNDPRIPFIRLAMNSDSVHDEVKIGRVFSKERQKIERNGSQAMRLAASMFVLLTDNTGFNSDDRQTALQACTRMTKEGCEYGYRRDAWVLLDMSLRNEATTVPCLASLAEEALDHPTTRRKAAEKEIVSTDDYLLRYTPKEGIQHKLAEGKTVSARWTDYNNSKVLIVEERDGTKVTKGTVCGIDSNGKSYNKTESYYDVLCSEERDLTDRNRRLEIARQILSKTPIKSARPSEENRLHALSVMSMWASSEYRDGCEKVSELCHLVDLDKSKEKEFAIRAVGELIKADGSPAVIATIKNLPTELRAEALTQMAARTGMVADVIWPQRRKGAPQIRALVEKFTASYEGVETNAQTDAAVMRICLEASRLERYDSKMLDGLDVSGVMKRLASNPVSSVNDPRFIVCQKQEEANRNTLFKEGHNAEKFEKSRAFLGELIRNSPVSDEDLSNYLVWLSQSDIAAARTDSSRIQVKKPATSSNDSNFILEVMKLAQSGDDGGELRLKLLQEGLEQKPLASHLRMDAWSYLADLSLDNKGCSSSVRDSARDLLKQVAPKERIALADRIRDKRKYGQDSIDLADTILKSK